MARVVNYVSLTSTHNSPPTAGKKEKRMFGGHSRAPGRGPPPSALLLPEGKKGKKDVRGHSRALGRVLRPSALLLSEIALDDI